jgi:hypothetical protein
MGVATVGKGPLTNQQRNSDSSTKTGPAHGTVKSGWPQVWPKLQLSRNQHTTASTTGQATRHSRGTAYLSILINCLLRRDMGHRVVPSPRPVPTTTAGLLPPTAWTRTCARNRTGAQLLLGLGGGPLPVGDDLLGRGGAGDRGPLAAQAPTHGDRRQTAALAGCCGRRTQTVRQGENWQQLGRLSRNGEARKCLAQKPAA